MNGRDDVPQHDLGRQRFGQHGSIASGLDGSSVRVGSEAVIQMAAVGGLTRAAPRGVNP